MDNKNDEDLMKLVINGDERAFGIIVGRHLSKALLFAERLVGSYNEDVVQEAFVKMWKNAYKFDPNKALVKTWFYRILTNTCYSKIKKEKINKIYPIEDERLEDKINIEKDIIKKQNKENLLFLIKELNQREQQAIILRYIEDFSNKETAEVMKTSVKAIETLIFRSKTKLKKLYERREK